MIVTKDLNIGNSWALLTVAGGLGGHAHGEIASKLACEELMEYFNKTPIIENRLDIYHHRIHQLKETIQQLHHLIVEYSYRYRLLNQFVEQC